MEPPSPPSPPLGPPFSMNFSRRKLMHPLPPSPAFTRIDTSSTNFITKRLSPYGRAEKQSRHKTLAKMSAATPNHDTYIVRRQPIQTALQETHPTNEKAPSR